MEVRQEELSALVPYEKNGRRNEKGVRAVMKSIERYGFKVPLVIDEHKEIVCGHTRYKAAKKLGLSKVPCIVAKDLTAEQIAAYRLVDNKTSELSKWNYEKLSEELNSLISELPEELTFELPATEELGVEEKLGEDLRPMSKSKEYETLTFRFTPEERKEVAQALSRAIPEIKETYGNGNQKGNALYEIVRQWADKNGIRTKTA